MRFKNKLAFITGGASGIGRAAAVQFAKEGATIAIADWNLTGAEETISMVKELGGNGRAWQLDVSNYERVKEVIKDVHIAFERIDIALNNAGIGGATPAKTAQHTLEDWDHVIAVNQSGVFYCMKEELKVMHEQKSGVIVNISSIAGLKGLPNQAAYVASKHAVIGLTRTGALEYARHNVRVNAVCPVFTNSPMLESMFSMKETLRDKLVHTIPLGRYGEVEDIVNAITWLSDDSSSFVTGLCLPIDGGQQA